MDIEYFQIKIYLSGRSRRNHDVGTAPRLLDVAWRIPSSQELLNSPRRCSYRPHRLNHVINLWWRNVPHVEYAVEWRGWTSISWPLSHVATSWGSVTKRSVVSVVSCQIFPRRSAGFLSIVWCKNKWPFFLHIVEILGLYFWKSIRYVVQDR